MSSSAQGIAGFGTSVSSAWAEGPVRDRPDVPIWTGKPEEVRVHEVQVDELVRAMARLGALPVSLGRLAAVTGAPEFDFGEVVDVVAHDMVLAAGVLRAANSAASGSMSRVENVREAVIRLGAARTLAAAMLTMVGARFERQLIVYGLDPGELWCHSCAASIAADLVRNEAKILLPASLGTTGLVHDIGKLVLDGVVAERDETCGFDGATGPELCELERDRFGLDHAEAGAIVASYWQLPPAIVEGIRAHHAAVDDPVGVSIALADTIAYAVARGGAHDELAALRLARLLGISHDGIPGLVATTAERLEQLVGHYHSDDEQ
jgi:HD-like signal output (HDOD) protein